MDRTLAEFAASDAPLPERLRVARELAAVVASVGARGRAHGALAPDAVVVLDGASVALRPAAPAPFLARAGFEAPEVARGGHPSPRTDAFSLGALAWLALAGRPPFGADDPLGAAWRVLHADAGPVRLHAPAVPLEVEAAIAALLEKKARRRARPEELASAIDAVLAPHGPVAAPPLPGPLPQALPGGEGGAPVHGPAQPMAVMLRAHASPIHSRVAPAERLGGAATPIHSPLPLAEPGGEGQGEGAFAPTTATTPPPAEHPGTAPPRSATRRGAVLAPLVRRHLPTFLRLARACASALAALLLLLGRAAIAASRTLLPAAARAVRAAAALPPLPRTALAILPIFALSLAMLPRTDAALARQVAGLLERGDTGRARAVVDEAARRRPSDPTVEKLRGDVACARGAPGECLRRYRVAIAAREELREDPALRANARRLLRREQSCGTRRAAAQLLGELRDPDALPALEDARRSGGIFSLFCTGDAFDRAIAATRASAR